MDRTYQANLQVAKANDVSLPEVLIMNALCQAKLIVDDVFFCEEDQAWYANIPQDGEVYLGKTVGEAFDQSFNLSLQSTRCSQCNQFTILIDEELEPFCGQCETLLEEAPE